MYFHNTVKVNCSSNGLKIALTWLSVLLLGFRFKDIKINKVMFVFFKNYKRYNNERLINRILDTCKSTFI